MYNSLGRKHLRLGHLQSRFGSRHSGSRPLDKLVVDCIAANKVGNNIFWIIGKNQNNI